MAEIKGGEKLEAYLNGLAARAAKPGTLKVGFLAGATYPDGTPVAFVAAMNEFGHGVHSTKYATYTTVGGYVPPRPFFRNMVKAKSGEWGPKLGHILSKVDFDGQRALEILGDQMAGDLRQSIKDTNSPALKPATIRRKGFDKPLVDTGYMLGRVDFEVT